MSASEASSEASSEVAPEALAAAPEKRRETRKIQEIKIDRPYGQTIGGHPFLVEPSVNGVFQAVASGMLDERVFEGESQNAVYAECDAKAAGNPADFLRFIQEYHERRVAYFIVNGWDDYIGLNDEGALRDGGHRLRAAMFMGKKEVNVEIG